MEATGVYHLALAIALNQANDVEVMVLNPQVPHSFARSLAPRGKSDKKDAATLLTYLERMDFEPWQPPEPELLRLRSLTRRCEQMAKELLRERNRLHALERDSWVDELVLEQSKERIETTQQMLTALEERAQELVLQAPGGTMAQDVALLCSVPGIGTKTAIVLVSELTGLGEGMTPRQWVAQVGLDPCERTSGSSVHTRGRISKRGNRFVRRALFLVAMTSSRFCEPIAAFKEELEKRGKAKKQALVAIMRKLIHCIHGMLRHRTEFDAARFRGPATRAISTG